MRELCIAITICWMMADAVTVAYPFGMTQEQPIRVVTVSVCSPKDEARVVSGMIIPKLVPTERVLAISALSSAQRTKQRR